MEVERHLQLFVLGPLEEVRGRGEQLLLPRVARPADALTVFVLRRIALAQAPCLVPVHIDDQHVDRHVHRLEFVHQIDEFVVRILPVAAPPVAQRIFRRHRRAAGDERVVGQRLFVVVSVGEEVEVLTVAFGTRFDPLFPFGTVGRQHMTLRIVDQGPARAGEDALLHRLLEFRTVGAVERAGRAQQVLRIFHAGSPDHLLAVEREYGFQVFVAELAVLKIRKRQRRGRDREFRFAFADLEFGNRSLAIDERQRRTVFELSVGTPLHADQLRREHRKAGVSRSYDGFGVGLRVVCNCRRQRAGERCQEGKKSFHLYLISLVTG